MPRYEVCQTCSGSGAKPGSKKTTCPQCRGAGRTVISNGLFQMAQTCSRCSGEGSIIQTPCSDCRGEGKSKVARKIKVKIPAGVENGSHLRIRGEGERGSAASGDLYVIIEIAAHPVFQRHNNDILTEVSISLTKAILGAVIEVPTLQGHAKMKIPAGTQSHNIFRLKEKGIPDLRSNAIGDELVRVNVEIPTRLNAEQRKIIETLAKSMGEEVENSSFADKIKKAFK